MESRSALIVDPETDRGEDLVALAVELSFEATMRQTCDEAWPIFAKLRPAVVLAGLSENDNTAEEFLRKLQTQYMGTMPRVYFVGHPWQMEHTVLRPEGLLVPPLSRDVLTRVLRPDLEIGDTTARQVSRLRELYELSALSNDLAGALDVLVSRACLTFRTENCILWGPGEEAFWPRTARTLPEGTEGRTLELCRSALAAQIPTVITNGEGTRSYIASGLGSADPAVGGGICLIADGCRLFSADEIDTLRVFGNRISKELTFVSAHYRLMAAHNRLRESALLDPLLSVWTRAAFERSVVKQIASSRRRKESLHLAVFDFVRLRAVNDRYGHLAGDAVLAHFARTVREGLRAQDQVGRFGGDELAVLLVGSDSDGAATAVEKLLDQLEETPLVVSGHGGALRIGMDVSVGLTRILPDEVSGERAFSRALAARGRARRAHKRLEISTPQELGQSGEAESSLVFDVSAYSGIPSGSTIGGMYRVLHEISRGAMGVVYRGEDLGLGRPVAIKVLRSDLASDRGLVARFRDEAAVLAALRHRNLVQVYAFGEDGQDVFFVMELVEGQPLSDVIDHLIQTQTTISVEAALKIVDEIAEALESIHAEGMIHRDVKPANVLLDRINDRAVLVDVGVAKRAHEVSDAAGTPGFAAPESFTETPESSATDVYGLATTTYAMLCGSPPFGGGEILAVVNRQLFDPVRPPSSYRPDLPGQVDAVMLKALDPDPDKRYQSATAFSISFSRALARRSIESARQAAISSEAAFPDFEMPHVSMPLVSMGDSDRETTTGTSLSRELVSRGAFFSIARKILIHQLGAGVVEALADSSVELADLLDPRLLPTEWFPVQGLVDLIEAAGPRAQGGSKKLARRLGRSVISATLSHLFGANPASVAPAKLVAASSSFWSRYHSWGSVLVEDVTSSSATLLLESSPGQIILCCLVEGMFARTPELAGAEDVDLEHASCVCRGDAECRFFVSWAGSEQ